MTLPPPTDAPPQVDVPACEFDALRKSFGAKVAVDGLSLRVPRGTLYAFLGPNGAGKTTSLRMLAGLLRPDFGRALIDGIDVHVEPERAKQVLAYVPDEPSLYGKLTPVEFLDFVAALWSVPNEVAKPRAMALLEQLALADRAGDRIEALSRGMKQKVALAAAMLHAPRLLMLDEPLTGLDAAAARGIKDMLLRYCAEGGTVLLTTHILEVAERLAQRIGIIARGKLLAEGTFADLRRIAAMPDGTLEDVFLRLVGTTEGMGGA